MLKLESIAAFSAIAEAGSITGAARRLALSESVVSERLTELERVVAQRSTLLIPSICARPGKFAP